MRARLYLSFCIVLLLMLTACGRVQETRSPVITSAITKPAPRHPEIRQAKTHKIGLLLPLSGPHAALGQDLLNAAELALFDTPESPLILCPHDTALGAKKAAEKALREGAELLIGPIFAADVREIKPLLSQKNVNLLCFSTDEAVAGGGVYLLGFLPSQQIERIITHIKQQGLTRIAAFIPSDAYGKVIERALRKLEAQKEITLLGISHYPKSGAFDQEMAFSQLIADLEVYKMQRLDALIIPEGGEVLETLARSLGDQDSFKILGSGQWDTPGTISIPGLGGGLFASTPPENWKEFETRFQAIHGTSPCRIAGLAYDAVSLAVALEKTGYTPKELTRTQGFLGIEGLFRLTPQGMNERGLAVLRVTPVGFQTEAIAPQAF